MFLLALAALGGCASAPPRRTAPSPSARGTATLPAPAAENLDEVLNRDPDPKRNELVLIALSQVGVPYRWGGHSPLTGFDCSGLVVYVYQQALQLRLPRTTFAQARDSLPVDAQGLRPADLVFFNTLGPAFSHVGIYIGNHRFVHAPTTGSAVQIDRLHLPYWTGRFDGGRRLIS